VLLVPFDSLAAVARGAMPWLPVDLLLRDRWDAAAEAPYRNFPPGVAELVVDPALHHNTALLDSGAFRVALQAR
jgi:hypothetical protein